MTKTVRKTTKAIIIAAGRGIRLNAHSQEIPKSLIHVNGRSILETNLLSLATAGIEYVYIVTGYKREKIEQALGDGHAFDLKIEYIFNPEWQKKNGTSVYAAHDKFAPNGSFLLMMSDHLFSPQILSLLQRAELSSQQVALAIDRKIDSVFDIDDAMKVRTDHQYIVEIGKDLRSYDAIDCGIFKCTTHLFGALHQAMIDNDCSLADGCRQLIRTRQLIAVDIADAKWIDIDTPEALAHAQRMPIA